jgi:hypothetical protein
VCAGLHLPCRAVPGKPPLSRHGYASRQPLSTWKSIRTRVHPAGEVHARRRGFSRSTPKHSGAGNPPPNPVNQNSAPRTSPRRAVQFNTYHLLLFIRGGRRLQFLDLACHHEDRPLADVGDAVGQAFHVVRRPQEHVSAFDHLRVGDDKGH